MWPLLSSPPASHQVTKEVMKMARALTLMPQRPDSAGSEEVTRDNSLDFGAAELAGFPNLQLGVALQVGRRSLSLEGCVVQGRAGSLLTCGAAKLGGCPHPQRAGHENAGGLAVQQTGLAPHLCTRAPGAPASLRLAERTATLRADPP